MMGLIQFCSLGSLAIHVLMAKAENKKGSEATRVLFQVSACAKTVTVPEAKANHTDEPKAGEDNMAVGQGCRFRERI